MNRALLAKIACIAALAAFMLFTRRLDGYAVPMRAARTSNDAAASPA